MKQEKVTSKSTILVKLFRLGCGSCLVFCVFLISIIILHNFWEGIPQVQELKVIKTLSSINLAQRVYRDKNQAFALSFEELFPKVSSLRGRYDYQISLTSDPSREAIITAVPQTSDIKSYASAVHYLELSQKDLELLQKDLELGQKAIIISEICEAGSLDEPPPIPLLDGIELKCPPGSIPITENHQS